MIARGISIWDIFCWSSFFSQPHFRSLLRQIHRVQAGKAAFPIVLAEPLSVMTVQPAHRPKIVRPIWAAVQQTANLSKAARLSWNHHREIVLADREPIALAPEAAIIAIPIAGRKATFPIDGNSWKCDQFPKPAAKIADTSNQMLFQNHPAATTDCFELLDRIRYIRGFLALLLLWNFATFPNRAKFLSDAWPPFLCPRGFNALALLWTCFRTEMELDCF